MPQQQLVRWPAQSAHAPLPQASKSFLHTARRALVRTTRWFVRGSCVVGPGWLVGFGRLNRPQSPINQSTTSTSLAPATRSAEVVTLGSKHRAPRHLIHPPVWWLICDRALGLMITVHNWWLVEIRGFEGRYKPLCPLGKQNQIMFLQVLAIATFN
jgi:hypothetical protein